MPQVVPNVLTTDIGKTTTLRFTIDAINNSPMLLGTYRHVGTILCLGRRAEIERMITGLGLTEADYAVLVAQDAENSEGQPFADMGLGKDNINKAPFLFTTHAMMETRLVERNWADAKAFYYLDKPRRLRIWDEAVFVRKGITIDRDALFRLRGSLGDLVGQEIEGFIGAIDDAKDGTILEVPDVAADHSIQTVWGGLKSEEQDYLSDDIKDFWFMSGKPVLVRKAQAARPTLITYQTRLPADIKPMLVLDASARVRETYRQQEAKDTDIVWLPTCPKRYNNVTVAFEYGPSGRSGLGQNWQNRIAQVAEIIRRHPDRKALVLHHKEARGKGIGDVEKAVKHTLKMRHGLGADKTGPFDVKFCHWGEHTAVNHFRDRDLIITASIFREPPAVTEARGRASADRPVDREYTAEELRALRHGEVMHDLLQGLSRGRLRNLVGDQAQECLIYLMGAKNSGIRDDLDRLFPGCKVVDGWDLKTSTDGGEVTPRRVQVLKYIEEQFENPARQELTFPDIASAVRMQRPHVTPVINVIEPSLKPLGLMVQRSRGGKPSMIVRDPEFVESDKSVLSTSQPMYEVENGSSRSNGSSAKKSGRSNQGAKWESSNGKSGVSRGSSLHQSGIRKTAVKGGKSQQAVRRRY